MLRVNDTRRQKRINLQALNTRDDKQLFSNTLNIKPQCIRKENLASIESATCTIESVSRSNA
jgi:hypothetical protein